MKRHLFWRLTQTPCKQNATLSQELAACARLAWRYFPRLDRSDVGRAHVAIHRAILALAETGHFAGQHRVDSPHCPERSASLRVRHSGVTFAARCDLHDKSQAVDLDPLCECLGRLRVFRCHGRISPNLRPGPRRFGKRYLDR